MPRKGAVVDGTVTICAVVAVAFAAATFLRPKAALNPAPDQLLSSVRSLVGAKLPPIQMLNEHGTTTPSALPTRPTVIFIFRSTCEACERNAPQWRALADVVRPTALVSVVSLEGPDVAHTWLERQRILADTVLLPSNPTELAEKWHAQGVPLTLVVGASQSVKYAHLGILDNKDVASIRSLLLPH